MSARLEERIGTGEGVLAIYRAYNAPGEARLAFDSDFGAALNEPSPQEFGRGYLGYWETRNLRMAANIRRSEEHTSELQSLMRISYAVFCLKKKRNKNSITNKHINETQ